MTGPRPDSGSDFDSESCSGSGSGFVTLVRKKEVWMFQKVRIWLFRYDIPKSCFDVRSNDFDTYVAKRLRLSKYTNVHFSLLYLRKLSIFFRFQSNAKWCDSTRYTMQSTEWSAAPHSRSPFGVLLPFSSNCLGTLRLHENSQQKRNSLVLNFLQY